MVRKSARLLIAVVLILVLVTGHAVCEVEGNKAAMLLKLTQSGRTRLAIRAEVIAVSAPKEAAQLELDLIFYNWASRTSRTPTDVKNIDAIIPALAKALNDKTVDWAISYFSTNSESKVEAPLPAGDGERVQWLFDLKTQFRSAADYKLSSPLKAVEALLSAARLCQQLYLDISEALVLKQMGNHYFHDMARYPPAEACYDRAAWTFWTYRCNASNAVVYDDWGALNAEMGRYNNAYKNYVESARQWEQMAKGDPSRYRYRDMVGLAYIKAAEARKASGDYANALELVTANGMGIYQLHWWAKATKSYDLLIGNLVKAADFCRDAGDNENSLSLLKRAQGACELSAKLGRCDPLLAARVLDGLAMTYCLVNRPADQSAAIAKRNKTLRETAYAGDAALAELGLGSTLPLAKAPALRLAAKRGAQAYQDLRSYAKAAAAWRKVAGIYERAGLADAQIRSLRSLGVVLDALHKPQESLEARLEAVQVARKAGQSAMAAEIVQDDMIQSFIALNDLQNVLEGFTELTPIIEEAGNIRGAARVLEARGSLLARNGQYEEAIRDFSNARTRYVSQVGDLWAAGQVSLELAAAHRTSNQMNEARKTLESAIDEIETKYGSESFGGSGSERRTDIIKNLYRELAKMYVHEAKMDAAMNLVRKGKRYPWLSKLIVDMRNDAADAEVAKWANGVDVMIIDVPGPALEGSGERLLANDWAKFLESCLWLEKQHPREYSELPVDPVDLLKSRRLMPEGLLAVEYLPTESSMYVFVCGRDKAICRKVGVQRNSIDALVTRLRRTLKNCEETDIPIPPMVGWQESAFLEIKEPLLGLYTQLITPIQNDLSGRQRLAFVLPDEFAGLPMHALISSEDGSKPIFMVEDYEISYLTRGMLDDLASSESRSIDPGSDWLAIFADPEGNLPGAQKEALNLKGAYLNSRWYVGSERATATNLLNECKQANVLHIAAHHREDPNPAGFQLLLAPDKDSDGTIGIEDLWSVENPRLQLVVLSACDSIGSADPISSGTAHAAEVFSLAGAKSVLGGLWKVSDQAASKVMGDFYRGLNRGKSRTEALQRALVNMIESKQFAHPFYWACFALYGNPR